MRRRTDTGARTSSLPTRKSECVCVCECVFLLSLCHTHTHTNTHTQTHTHTHTHTHTIFCVLNAQTSLRRPVSIVLEGPGTASLFEGKNAWDTEESADLALGGADAGGEDGRRKKNKKGKKGKGKSDE